MAATETLTTCASKSQLVGHLLDKFQFSRRITDRSRFSWRECRSRCRRRTCRAGETSRSRRTCRTYRASACHPTNSLDCPTTWTQPQHWLRRCTRNGVVACVGDHPHLPHCTETGQDCGQHRAYIEYFAFVRAERRRPQHSPLVPDSDILLNHRSADLMTFDDPYGSRNGGSTSDIELAYLLNQARECGVSAKSLELCAAVGAGATSQYAAKRGVTRRTVIGWSNDAVNELRVRTQCVA